ncbi:MAG TPA: hypothetical protein VFV34_07635, partial [Blastocatellia bacterium]|nr:hypothetical protein [Blastocatellia bacterium]
QGQKVASPTAGIVNALCNVQLNMVGCGFVANEATIICQGFQGDTGVPLQRPGKTVSNAQNVVCDTDGNGIPDLAIPLTNVTPVNANLIRGTLAVAPNATGNPRAPSIGSAFPFACCGGLANFTLTVTYTAGDNNQFGLFSLTTTCVIDLGNRAPVVKSATPSGPLDCTNPQDLLISGFCFILPNGTANVTSVFAVELGNPSNRVNAISFVILSPNLIDADFNFGSANNGKVFLIFVSGPSGQSRNLITTDPRPAGCPTGNEDGIQVVFRCQTPPQQCADPRPAVGTCLLSRNEGGAFVLEVPVTGTKTGATITISGQTPTKVKFKNGRFIIKAPCALIPGPIVVTNPGPVAQGCPANNNTSVAVQCNERCPSGQ